MTSGKELLQRILDDGSDSDSDLRQGHSMLMAQHSVKKQSYHVSAASKPISRLSTLTMDTDLERILRETDEDDDAESSKDLNISSLTAAPLYGIDAESLEESSNSSFLNFEVIRSPNHTLKSYKQRFSSFVDPFKASPTKSQSSASERRSSTDDWTLLQKILGEKEDDMSQEDAIDSNFDKRNTLSSGSQSHITGTHTQPLRKLSSSIMSEVDMILENLELEDDDDDDESDAVAIAELDEMASRFRSIHALSKSQRESLNFKKIETFPESSSLPSILQNDMKQRMASGPGVTLRVDTRPSSSSDKDAISKKQFPFAQKTPISGNLTTLDSITPLCDSVSLAAIKYAESYETRLFCPSQRDMISPLMVKRKMKPKIELPTKSRINKFGSIAPTQSHPRFNFAGVIDSRAFPKISMELLQNAQTGKRDVGLPTALAVNNKFITIGTQHGYALVYDHFEVLRQKLGLAASGTNLSQSEVSVTSLDLSSNGETLIAGYSNGAIILWDIIKGSVMKSVTDLHPSPITVCRFVSDQFINVVTVDAGGLVNKVTFSKTLWSSVGMESECLLDGTAGQILAMHVLPSFNSLKGTASYEGAKGSSIYHPSYRKLVIMALTSDRSSFVVAIEPKVHVLHRWPRPSSDTIAEAVKPISNDANNIDSFANISVLPCLAWGWILISGGENIVTPILSRSWGCSLQFLRAIFPPIEESNRSSSEDTNHWPAFGLHDEFEASAPIVALEWLGDRSLVYLTITNEFTVVDSIMMTLTERLDFSSVKLVYAEYALSRAVMNKEKSSTGPHMSTTFLNSIRSNDERILILCREELRAVSILDIHKRVQALEEDGEWLEALALALDYYESTVRSQEDRKRDPEGKRDLSNHPEFLTRLRLSEDDEWLAELLRRYLNLAVENAPESASEQLTISSRNRVSSSRLDLSHTHFQMLAGVCIEFCVVSRRPDLLYAEIFDKFHSSGNSSIFFEVLEPYIMNDKLKYVAAEVMAHFVNNCKVLNDLSTFERCLIHMDVSIMDFDTIVSLLRKNSMHSALFHVYTAGLDDFITPLEILFESIFDYFEVSIMRRSDGTPMNLFHQYGYKAILYIRQCLQGKAFPRGDPLKPDNRVEKLRPQVLFFLLRSNYDSVNRGISNNLKDTPGPLRESSYPYLRALILLDPKAVFDTYDMVFDNPAVRFMKSSEKEESDDDWHQPQKYGEQTQDLTLCPDRQEIAQVLTHIMKDLKMDITLVPYAFDCFYDFLAKHLVEGVIRTPKQLTTNIFSRICTKSCLSTYIIDRKEAEEYIISLLKILPMSSLDIDDILHVLEQSRFTRAALFLHKTGVYHRSHGSSHHFVSVIDCYLHEEDPYFRLEVFKYIKEECSKEFVTDSVDKISRLSKLQTNRELLRLPLLSKFPDLVKLDAIQAARMISELYEDDLEPVFQSLDHEDGMLLYTFLEKIISGELSKADSYAGPLLLSSLAGAHYQRYLELMAKFHPEHVYKFLCTHDNYRLDDCLKMCQSHDIPDASAYLLERLGNISGAQQLLLQTLEGRLMILKRKIRGLNLHLQSTGRVSPHAFVQRFNGKEEEALLEVMKTREFQSTKLILDATLDLCERNSNPSASSTEYGSQLWLTVVDRLINAKGFLRPQNEKPEHSQILLRVVTDLLHTSLQRMIKRVPLSRLIRMITMEYATHRLSDIREMISVMLQVYGSEAHLSACATQNMQNNAHAMTLSKHNLKRRAIKAVACSNPPVYDFQRNSTLDFNALSHILLHINNDGNAFLQKPNNLSYETVGVTSRHPLLRDEHLNRARAKNNNSFSVSSFGSNIRTKTDALFNKGFSSEAACITRHYGTMSPAEHFGRLA